MNMTLCCPATLSLTLVTTELPIASVVSSAGVTLCKVDGWMRGRLVYNLLRFIAVCFLPLISWLLESSFWRMANSLASHDRSVLAVRGSLTAAVTLNLSSSMKLRSTFNSGKQHSNKSYEYSNDLLWTVAKTTLPCSDATAQTPLLQIIWNTLAVHRLHVCFTEQEECFGNLNCTFRSDVWWNRQNMQCIGFTKYLFNLKLSGTIKKT